MLKAVKLKKPVAKKSKDIGDANYRLATSTLRNMEHASFELSNNLGHFKDVLKKMYETETKMHKLIREYKVETREYEALSSKFVKFQSILRELAPKIHSELEALRVERVMIDWFDTVKNFFAKESPQ